MAASYPYTNTLSYANTTAAAATIRFGIGLFIRFASTKSNGNAAIMRVKQDKQQCD